MSPIEKISPLSACVNCRDDETTIGRWIECVSDYVAEIIICDTGSQDKTREIILGYGLKKLKFLERPWPGFLEARNWFFDLVAMPYILQLDSDEMLLPTFWQKLPEYLLLLSKGHDSIRLKHYSAKFDFSSFAELDEKARRFNDHFAGFSYPRDILYRADLKQKEVVWKSFHKHGEIFNNLATSRYWLDVEPLVHCYPRNHKIRNDEYHARKILAYAKLTPGYWEPGWTDFLNRRFSPEKLEEMKKDTLFNDDPAPHSTWWSRTGRFQQRSESK